jgi:uncharacterized membrane protein YphA (DoxX/SURF4 family)
MNTALWIIQGLLAAMFLFSGGMKLVAFDRYTTMIQERSAGKGPGLSRMLATLIGASEVAGSFGLILPHATGILPVLTPLAALGLAVIMMGATVYHWRRREAPFFTIVLLGLTLFVAFARSHGM